MSTQSSPFTAQLRFTKAFTRENSLLLSELLGQAATNWLKRIEADPPPFQVVSMRQGLVETWFCQQAVAQLIADVHRHNLQNPAYLRRNVARYRQLIQRLEVFEKCGPARDLLELRQYLTLFRQAMLPLHVVFFTPLAKGTPRVLQDLALTVRGQDALFDTSDLYVRRSLAGLYPECKRLETFIGLQDLDKPDIGRLKQRTDDFILFNEEYLAISLEEFRIAYPAYDFKIEAVDRGQTVLEGSTACPGVVEGRVQIVLRKTEVVDFRAGNVLVAPMTTPHYLPAMRRAVAFVTDEGGVTCHAAIVAREMKTPCVIGTGIATSFLANGDLVRVDADRAKITVLARAASPS